VVQKNGVVLEYDSREVRKPVDAAADAAVEVAEIAEIEEADVLHRFSDGVLALEHIPLSVAACADR
jgi:hypothetical protein